ncbi:MAG TPA: alkaline phosphatase family protein [Acidimicrobiales bacterium]
MGDPPDLPDYSGACLNNVVPALLGPAGTTSIPAWMPEPVRGARQLVLLVLDGLGWEQLGQRHALAPTLSAMAGGWVHTVVPSTTATALTSIAVGLTPGEHGVVGYRIDVHGEVLNVLRWSTPHGDARKRVPPAQLQPVPPFMGANIPVVTRAEFNGSGFSLAHLAGTRHVGYRASSTLVVEVRRLLTAGERFVYAYYDGIDKVAHEYGLGAHYDQELRSVDRLVADILSELPPGAVLLVTADHGQVDVGANIVVPASEVLALTDRQSGEGRFRWLHARSGAVADLAEAAAGAHGDQAWVVTLEQVRDEGWFGPRLTPQSRERLGDVALVARGAVSFDDPADTGPFELISRHGSLTAAEMRVPLLAAANP